MGTPLDEFVTQLLDDVGMVGPPIDSVEIAKRLGIVVAVDRRLSGRARRVCLVVGEGISQPVVYVRPEPRPERLQWSVAHELGEHLAVKISEAVGGFETDATCATPAARERAANQFAEALLVPRALLETVGAAGDWDLPQLKQAFATASHELIARRVVAVRRCTIATIFDDGRLHARLTGRGFRTPWQPCEREILRLCADSGLPQERHRETLRLRCWPIHEPGRKREILLTEALDEEF